MNLVDLFLVAFVGLLSYRGYRRGFIREGIEFAAIVLGIWLAVNIHQVPAAVLTFFRLDRQWSELFGGLLIFATAALGGIIGANKIHDLSGQSFHTTAHRAGGALLASAWSAFLGVFILVLTLVVPAPASLQRSIQNSFVGETVLASDSAFYTILENSAKSDARKFMFYLRQHFAMLEPDRRLDPEKCLDVRMSSDIEIEESAESELLDLINKERRRQGLESVAESTPLRDIARGHSEDMYQRGYFCHTNPEGRTAAGRITEARISFSVVGENLSLAPTVWLAHRGLMNSPNHRENILRQEFTALGVGVFVGPSGLMITENFCSACEEVSDAD